jgi:hypothetical protein
MDSQTRGLGRTQIEKETSLGKEVSKKFCEYDGRRAARRKPERDLITMILPGTAEGSSP